MGSNKYTVEGDVFTAEVKAPKEGLSGEWLAKVRLVDDGERGKNVTLAAITAEELSDRLGEFANAFAATQAKVLEVINTYPTKPEPAVAPEPEQPLI